MEATTEPKTFIYQLMRKGDHVTVTKNDGSLDTFIIEDQFTTAGMECIFTQDGRQIDYATWCTEYDGRTATFTRGDQS